MSTLEDATLLLDMLELVATDYERAANRAKSQREPAKQDYNEKTAARLRDAAQRLREEWQIAGDASETDVIARGVMRALTRINLGGKSKASPHTCRHDKVGYCAACHAPTTPEPHICPSCDLDDSIKVPPGKLLASTPIRKPAEPPLCEPWCGTDQQSHVEDPQGMVHYAGPDLTCLCSPACRDLGRPANPRKPTP